MRLIHHVNCTSIPDGVILEWKLLDETKPRSVTIYANRVDRRLVIKDSPWFHTGRCKIDLHVATLVNNYQIHVEDEDGNFEDSDPVRPQLLKPEARRILQEIRDRELVYMKSHPFGAFKFALLLKNQFGEPCDKCGDGLCFGKGHTGFDLGCPLCLGTGMRDPYFVYPEFEYMLEISPKDDKTTGDKEAMRSVVTRTFRSVFPYYLREEDVIIAENEAYQIKMQDVIASVGNAPAVYQITCVQFPMNDQRYPSFNKIVEDMKNGKYHLHCNN